MKYCPYCGCELVGEEAAFCMECGKPMPERSTGTQENVRNDANVNLPQDEAPDTLPESDLVENEAPEPIDPDAGYDGYYDDVVPDDYGDIRSGVDKQLIKKVVVLGVSVVLIICACVAIMYIL